MNTLHNLFYKLIDEYPSIKKQAFKGNPFAKLVKNEIPTLLKTYIQNDQYSIEGSVGKGKWACIPWICIYDNDITDSVKKGIYISFLLAEDTGSIYLTLNQGCTAIKKQNSKQNSKQETIRILRKNARDIIDRIDARSFLSDQNIFLGNKEPAELYQKGTIFYKEYKKDTLPNDAVLTEDLHNMLAIYKKYKNELWNNKDIFMETENNFMKQITPNNNLTTLRYVRSLLAKPFAILTGNSGTGKTRIALKLAKYLEKSSTNGNYKNSLLIPVGADWTDNTKLLGFYNPMTHRYQSTATLDFILKAQKNPDIPFFLILDEMNLSHVERYFSDFLSAMESGENIPLYKKDVDCKEEVIPESIKLPQNLFVTGTVNIDETTYMFSPKVLDRANVIEFKPEMNDVLNLFFDDSKNTEVETAESGVAEAFLEISKTVRSSQLADYSSIPFNDAKETFKSLYEILEKSGFEFAFRTVKEIRHYIIAAYELSDNKDEFDVTSVLDEQIVQKILPKIHGNRKQIGSLLDELKAVCTETSYKLSNGKIVQMQDRLEKYQYASFI